MFTRMVILKGISGVYKGSLHKKKKEIFIGLLPKGGCPPSPSPSIKRGLVISTFSSTIFFLLSNVPIRYDTVTGLSTLKKGEKFPVVQFSQLLSTNWEGGHNWGKKWPFMDGFAKYLWLPFFHF